MTTYKTLDDARADRENKGMYTIVEIEHVEEGIFFIGLKCSLDILKSNLSTVPEIKSIIKEHGLLSDAEIKKMSDDNRRCEKCGKRVNEKAYSQVEWHQGYKVITHYCDDCTKLLKTIGAGEYTAMQDRSADKTIDVPSHKQDH